METQKLYIHDPEKDREAVEQAGKILREGGLVAFPTETVYGLGANALLPDAAAQIYQAKGRPSDNPLIVHVTEFSEVFSVAREVPPEAELLFRTFSPGPMTVILKKRPEIPDQVTAGLDTVAIRIPSHPAARAVIAASGVPIAAPSANRSGKPSPTCAEDVAEDMEGRIDAIIYGGSSSVGVESTIIDLSGEIPTILRPGGITPKDFLTVLPKVQLDRHVFHAVEGSERPKCPGMKYRHYAPEAEVIVYEGAPERLELAIREELSKNPKKPVAVLCMNWHDYDADLVIKVGTDNRDYAKNLFHALRKCDREGMKLILAEFTEDDGYGLAVQNRLYKSAGNHVLHI